MAIFLFHFITMLNLLFFLKHKKKENDLIYFLSDFSLPLPLIA